MKKSKMKKLIKKLEKDNAKLQKLAKFRDKHIVKAISAAADTISDVYDNTTALMIRANGIDCRTSEIMKDLWSENTTIDDTNRKLTELSRRVEDFMRSANRPAYKKLAK